MIRRVTVDYQKQLPQTIIQSVFDLCQSVAKNPFFQISTQQPINRFPRRIGHRPANRRHDFLAVFDVEQFQNGGIKVRHLNGIFRLSSDVVWIRLADHHSAAQPPAAKYA